MKFVKYICSVVVMALAFVACNDDNSVHLGDYAYVRIDNTTISLVTGEAYQVHASVNGVENPSLRWSIQNSEIATVQGGEGTTAVVTAVSAGSTLLKVETADGSFSYYADVLVSSGTPAIKILSVSNGTSGNESVSSYLRDIATAQGKTVEIGIAYVDANTGLANHLDNATASNAVYNYNFTDVTGSTIRQTGKTLRSIIMGDTWDYIVFEESVAQSGVAEGYTTSLQPLIDMASEIATNPNVKFLVNQPWAYANTATETGFENYEWDQTTMFQAIASVMTQVEGMGIGVIPTGTAIQNVRTSYLGETVVTDGQIHLSQLGKFAAACTWYEALLGEQVTYEPGDFISFDCRLASTAAQAAIAAPTVVTTLTEFVEKINEFVLTKPIYIDFGPIPSPAPFNNYLRPTDPPLGNLKDEDGNETAFDLAVTSPFTGVIERVQMEQNNLGLPKEVSRDCFFCDGDFIPEATMQLSNLNKDLKYTFVFYGNINDTGAQTLFTLTGKNVGTATLVNDYNVDRVAVIEGIEPNDNACIDIKYSIGPENTQRLHFFGVNAMLIVPEGYQLPF